jgi:heme O synthase-like polyprenyltransferase
VGPDRAKNIRNILIIVALAVVVWLVPGGGTGSSTIYNLLTIILTAGLLFFGYRLYMEHRATIFGLGDNQRAWLYGSVALATLALLATSRLWDEGGAGVLIWMLMIGLAVWGVYRVWREYSEY